MTTSPSFDLASELTSWPEHGHLILEASAGSGKTYSLEHLVWGLLTRGRSPLSIGEILVVTYTNQAAWEMKNRIRRLLTVKKVTADEAERSLLDRALSDFDQCAIHTIHGFCQKTLKALPFESGKGFRQEVVEDGESTGKILREILRGDLAARGWDGLFRNLRRHSTNSFEVEVDTWSQEIASMGLGTTLWPTPEERRDLAVFLEDFLSGRGELGRALTRWFASGWRQEDFANLRKAVSNRGGPKAETLSDFHKYFYLPMSLSWSESGPSEDLLSALDRPFRGTGGSQTTAGKLLHELAVFFGQASELSRQAAEVDEALAPLYGGPQEERQTSLLSVFHRAEFLLPLRDEVRRLMAEEKALFGRISFDDMIEDLYAALSRPQMGEELVRALRAQYKAALVDEFQDTDGRQWGILRRLFDAPGHRLFVIGDPKQAIYRFRGTDPGAFHRAVSALEAAGARRFALDRNYRSRPSLTHFFNQVFSRIFPGRYFESLPPQKDGRTDEIALKGALLVDRTGAALTRETPVVLLSLNSEAPLSAPTMRDLWRLAIAREIKRLLTDHALLVHPAKASDERLSTAHIGILWESNRDCELQRRVLVEMGIPALVARQGSVLETDEARELELFLHALDNPSDSGLVKAALLTPLCGLSPASLSNETLEQAREAFWTAKELWLEKGLLRAVDGLLERFSYRTRVLAEALGERAVTNTSHLLELLHASPIESVRTPRAAAAELVRRGRSSGEEETHLMRLDTDEKAVRIMTIHAAKGLEFPVVFFAGALSQTRSRGGFPRFETANGPVLDLWRRSSSKRKEKEADWEEKKRLYYVAWTRAQSRLYLPVWNQAAKVPLADFYGLCEGTTSASFPLLQGLVTSGMAERREAISAPLDSPPTAPHDIQELGLWSASAPSKGFQALKPPDNALIRQRVPLSLSYTKLSRSLGEQEEDHGVLDPRGTVLVSDPPDEASGEENAPEADPLPRGKDFGTLFHALMEHIDFPSALATEDEFETYVRRLGEEQVPRWSQILPDKASRKALALLVRTILRYELVRPDGGFFRLCELPFQATRREWKFLFKEGKDLMNGTVDLAFRLPGTDLACLLDWKTDTIAPETSPEDMMQSRHYNLQAQVYGKAWSLYRERLAEFGRSTWRPGGMYYLFVRAMRTPGQGVLLLRG